MTVHCTPGTGQIHRSAIWPTYSTYITQSYTRFWCRMHVNSAPVASMQVTLHVISTCRDRAANTPVDGERRALHSQICLLSHQFGSTLQYISPQDLLRPETMDTYEIHAR